MAIEIEVALNPPVRSVVKKLVHAGAIHAYAPGATVHVRSTRRTRRSRVLEE